MLGPFLVPPYHAGSWWEQAGGSAPGASTQALRSCDGIEDDIPLTTWRSVESPDGKVRVWWQARYPADSAKAEEYARVVGTIWQALATLMGREPPSDNGDMRPCRGGDDRLDISLVDIGDSALVRAYTSTEDGPAPS
ncbi:MAG: hypothetical protein HC828_01360 [Blastochloris sp.]|nr:hypothetical protein [Blastochloris sp.]